MVDSDYGFIFFADEDISEEIKELYPCGLIARAEDIYSKNKSESEVGGKLEYLVKEIVKRYDLAEEDVRCCIYNDYEIKDGLVYREYMKAKRDGFEYFGILDKKSQDWGFLVLIAVKNIGKDKVIKVREKDESREDWIIITWFKDMLKGRVHVCTPSVCIIGDRINVEVVIGKDIPYGFDYMKYSRIYRDMIIDLFGDEISLVPVKQDIYDCKTYGKVCIEYEIKDKFALLALLKMQDRI